MIYIYIYIYTGMYLYRYMILYVYIYIYCLYTSYIFHISIILCIEYGCGMILKPRMILQPKPGDSETQTDDLYE